MEPTLPIRKPQSSTPNVPKPPEKKNIKGQRSFVKMLDDRKYLIDGIEEYNDEGELIDPWREGNTYILVKPLSAEHYIRYNLENGETIDKTTTLIMGFEFLQYQRYLKKQEGEDVPMIEVNQDGAYLIPEVGYLYGDPAIARLNLCAYIMSCHGKIVGFDEFGKYILHPISQKEILNLLPGNFANIVVNEETQETVFYELLKVSAVFNSDTIEKELVKDAELKEDELKNLPSKNGNTKSGKKPSKTQNEIIE
ncbi:MAG TPA: hypothetical protein VKR58_05970 [Aquella sp.]|nr:hypothetical protein [Aquella sp.]